jgi:hypothetical protein
MDQLQRQVARARRRLVLEQFLGRLVWCLLGALTIAAVAVAVPRVFVVETLPANWDMGWLLGAFASGFLGAVVWTTVRHRSPIDAAMEIDRRFDLRERVASSLSLRPEEQSTEAGRAVVNDAVRAVKRIEVDEKFRVRLDRRAWWPLVPAAIVFVLLTFVENRQASSSLGPNSSAGAEKQVKQLPEAIRKKFEERRKQAERQGLKEAEGLFKKIEQGTRELAEKQADRTKATVKLNDLTQQLEERRDQLGGKDSLKQQFKGMKNLGAGPAEKAANAMKQGDWKKAMEEVKELEKQLREGKLDENAKQQLAKQIEKMKEKLDAAAQAREQAMDDLKKQIEQQQRQGNLAKAGELQEKLDKMQKQKQQMDRLQQLAQQMGQIQQQLQQGDNQKAAQAMAKMAEQLGQMQHQMNELEMLDAAMEQLEMAKDALACEECDGEGCQACMGSLANMNQFNQNAQQQMGGMGGNPMAGSGPRPDEKNATNLRDTRVRQDPKQGSAVFAGMVEGPNVKGDVAQTIKEQMATIEAEPADPLTSERLPNSRREHAEEYFKILRDGK